ncbi:hypothetical protein KP509_12G006000 [Ceratopteris richardii]|nr:hypothetical protein KP509_12G006000 [Ceratopteris richardii]
MMMKDTVTLKPNLFTSIIINYGKSGNFEEALKVCEIMQNMGLHPHQICYHTLMNGYFKCGKVMKAFAMLDKMLQDGWKPNKITRNIVTLGLRCTDHGEEVKSFPQENHETSGPVSTSACNALLEDLYKSRSWEGAEALKRKIFAGLCKPDRNTYATILHGLSSQGKYDEAHEILLEMKGNGLSPFLAYCESLVSGLCRVSRTKEAYELFKDILEEGFELGSCHCEILLKQLLDEGMIDESMKVCKFLIDKGNFVQDTMIILLLEGLSNSNRLNEARPFLGHVLKKGYLSRSRAISQALRTLHRRVCLVESANS